MPNQRTIRRARADARRGKAPTTQAGEFVHEEIEHVRKGKHGARSPKQAIAIGLSKARRAGVKLPAPRRGTTGSGTRKKAERELTRARGTTTKAHAPSPRRSRAATAALKREGKAAASKPALSRQAKQAAARRKKTGAKRSPRRARARSR